MGSIEGIASSGSTYTSAMNINSSIVEGRRNFARPAETLAEVGTPGFEDYLTAASETNETEDPAPAFPCRSAKAGSNLSQMSYEDSDFGFKDVVDLLNPLQHIPVIGSLYRYVSGDDEIKPSTQVAGDMLYGGAIGGMFAGGLASIANAIIAQETGTAADQQIVQALLGPSDTETEQSEVMLADAAVDTNKVVTAAVPAPAETNKPEPESKIVVAESSASNKLLPGMRTKASFTTVSSKKTADTATVAIPAQSAKTSIPERQPFGGIMDTSAIKSAAMSKSNGEAVLVGGTIYSGSKFNNLGGVSKAAAPPSKVETTAPLSQNNENSNLSLEDQSQLGKVMHDSASKATASAQTGVKGNPLPPELVKDMMMMALDKYKSAEAMGKPAQTAGITLPAPDEESATGTQLPLP